MKLRVVIEYCVECLFLGRALETAQALLQDHAEHIESLTLKPGHDGVFNVFVNDRLISTVTQTGMPPSAEAIKNGILHAFSEGGLQQGGRS